MQLDETVTITVSLSDAFTAIDSVEVPVTNLTLDGMPSVSSDFTWINGTVTRRKVFRWTAHANGSGDALVGPVKLIAPDGQRDLLSPVSVQVLPDRTAGSNDPLKIAHELLATGRDPLFVIASVDRDDAWAGEEVVVTWTLYNGTAVQEWRIGDAPKLEDFWSEELDVRGQEVTQSLLGDHVFQKLVIRRVALFPLRDGTLTIDPLSVEASVLHRVTGVLGGIFEGMSVEITRRSAALRIAVRPLPPGPPVDAIGDLTLGCSAPRQAGGGPVAVDVALSGRGNLRAARPPHWERPPAGSVESVEGRLTVERARDAAAMTRRWRLLLFPAHGGRFVVPPLVTTVFTPAGVRRELRCEASALNVVAATPSAAPPPATVVSEGPAALWWPWAGGGVVVLVIVLAWRFARGARLRREVRALLRGDVRANVDAMLVARGLDPAALLRETTDRGDAYRAVRSLVDAGDRLDVDTSRELRRRVRELRTTIGP